MNPRSSAWRDLPIGRKGLLVVAIPVLPLLLTTLMYFRGEAAYQTADAASERAWRLRASELSLQARIFEAESASRAFALLGDDRLLDPYRRLRPQAEALLVELETETRDILQRERLPELRRLVMSRIDALDTLIRDARAGRTREELAADVRTGAAASQALRVHLGLILARNQEIIAERQARVARLRGRLNAIVTAGTAGGVAGGVVGALLFTTGISRRLSIARGNVSSLADGRPVVDVDAGADEIGVLTAETDRAARLLASRDAQLQQRMRDLEALTGELEAFSYSVSHDLRAPIRHISGFAAMLQKSAGDALAAPHQRHLKTIIEAAARMSRLIDDLLSFSRTSRANLQLEPVDLDALVSDVRSQLMVDLEGRSLRWLVAPLPRVRGDRQMLRVVFDNLLSNAVKYTRPREQAEIEIGTGPADGNHATIFVRDNGVGFDMQYENKLFGVFQRLHSLEEFEGTGIGLATVRRIVARHGGRAWADARPGEGATFFVTLPTVESTA